MNNTSTYNPKLIESNYYQLWEKRGYFELDGNQEIQEDNKYFSLMMPPPNVTGHLHIGHALTFTLQDIIVRYKRMDGYKTLWQSGVDHAGIATQNVVEQQLRAEGLTKEEIGRDEFLERAWQQKENSKDAITNQLKKLGVSPAWSRERFTMDKGLEKSVKKSFKQLFDNGFIIRDNYMINWCTHDGALSDIEVEYQDHLGKLYHIKYPLSDGSGEVVVATTRPETYFGDTAVMVNPYDIRYKHLIGKKVLLPLINREVEIIADSHVDIEFGTGLVKVTPAHDPNDYEVGKRHNLEFITIFDEEGILNNHCGEFKGLERLEARELIANKLKKEGFLVRTEEHLHQIGHCYRCNNIVEPYISKQWFIKKEFAQPSIEKVNKGEVKFFPTHWINSYNAWMNSLQDWCISRQLWWGHQIPVFYCNECNHQWVEDENTPTNCENCNSKNIYQDPDVLDTWFSSGLWAFSTLGWGHDETFKNELWNESDMQNFYPNSLLITGFDILFFWVARMIMMGENILGKLPFKEVYLHALVKDEYGEKMSKSKGNVIDPLIMIDKYSTDALRFTLALLAVQGRDIKLSENRLEQSRNFTNKLFNATNFLQLNQTYFEDLNNIEIKTPLGIYMFAKFNEAVKETREYLNVYRFNDGAKVLHHFLWREFCDWGIELSKANKESINELGSIFKESMKLLHPYMPFITEYIYDRLSKDKLENGAKSIMIQSYPTIQTVDSKIINQFDLTIESIVSIRRCKTLIDRGNQQIEEAYILLRKDLDKNMAKPFIEKLAKVDNIIFIDKKIKDSIADVSNHLESFIIASHKDIDFILTKLISQKEKLQREIDKLSNMLNNKNFILNAPASVIDSNKKTLTDNLEKLQKIDMELKNIKDKNVLCQ